MTAFGNGQVALVTGAAGAMGLATANMLAAEGYRVAMADLPGSKLHAAVTGIGASARGFGFDVSDPAETEKAFKAIESELGVIDVLINNAGILIARPFEELTLEDWDATMSTNVRSLYLVTRAVLPGMRQRKHGSIVNVASLAGRNGFAGGTAYTASKHAVLGFSRSLMLEVRKDNVRVIAICPGSVDTSLLKDQPMLKSEPSRILQPEEVADTILHTLGLPERAMVSELDIRPTNP
jgi:3-oxoacyl-[acyl-carrier protein] reductase